MERAVTAARTSYEEHREYVLAVLRRRCGWLGDDERESILHDAYVVLLEKERDGSLDPAAMHGNQVRAYLTQTALFKALDEGKRAERNRSAPLEDADAVEHEPVRSVEDVISTALDGARVREIVDELPRRRQAIVKLRFFFERTPGEIQELLGVSNRVYRRELERAVTQIADRYELVRAGRFCDSRRSLILAYVAGVAGPGRAREARTHLESCPGCSAWAVELRETTRRAAAVLPLPALVGGRLSGLGGLVARIREHLSALASSARHQGAVVAARADPGSGGFLVGARPGTVVATLAGCVALGGGTYCAVQGVPVPFGSLVSGIHLEASAERSHPEAHAKRQESVRVVSEPSRPVSEPQREPEPKPTPASPVASGVEGKLAQTAAAAETEFGPAGAGASSSVASGSKEASSSATTASSSAYPPPTRAPVPPVETAAAAAEFGP
ncbi:MAG TPA: sigma-70 family RNA polymerase sigma factor [Solirubrobacterales bacterium]|jgi:RNA polymerase sigma factor (sigma-70 family)